MANIISNGEDFVGESAALRARLMANATQEVLEKFEDEVDLFARSAQIDALKASHSLVAASRMRYALYWAGGKAEDRAIHQKRNCFNSCPSCYLCQCQRAYGPERFRCLCGQGKKMLSPYRVIWLSVEAREAWRTKIYDLNQHMYVPKSKFEDASPDWKTVNWQ